MDFLKFCFDMYEQKNPNLFDICIIFFIKIIYIKATLLIFFSFLQYHVIQQRTNRCEKFMLFYNNQSTA